MTYTNFDKLVIADMRECEQPFVDLATLTSIVNGVDLSEASVLRIDASRSLKHIQVLKLVNCVFLANTSFLSQLVNLKVLDVRGCAAEFEVAAKKACVCTIVFADC